MVGHLFTWPAGLGHLDVVQELVARGANLFVAASDGKTAFDVAFGAEHDNVVEATTDAGALPLMVACQAAASVSVLQVLLTTYPEALVYMQEYYSWTPPRAAPGAP